MWKFVKEKGQELITQNEITAKYELPEENSCSGGHEYLWKIYPAKDKKTNQEVSIWMFELAELNKVAKENRDKLKDILHKEMNTLKVLRHPHILKIVEVFEENRKFLAFATERVFCSLGNANKNYHNIANVSPELRNTNLSEFEVTSGLMQIGEALGFLHKDARRVHANLSPECIFLTEKGVWKIGGLGFSQQVELGQTVRSEWFNETHSQSIQRPIYTVEPNLCYAAPEVAGGQRMYGSPADMFSLGLLTYEFLRGPSAGGQTAPLLDVRDGNPMTHQYKISTLHPLNFPPSIPPLVHNTLRSCLQLGAGDRCDARGYLQSPFFDSGPIQTLRQIQTLIELDVGRQAQYLASLPPLLDPFPPRILRDMILPAFTSLTTNIALTPFLLPPIFKIVEKISKEEVTSQVVPFLAPLLSITDPPQTMLIFVQNLKILLEKADKPFIRDHVVPMLIRALDSNIVEIQDMVLKQLTLVADLFEYHVLKNNIQPRVQNLILQTTVLSVRVNSLISMAKMHHLFDKTALAEGLLPTLNRVLEVDRTPAVCMCVVGCYDAVGKTLGPEYMAKSIIPALTPLLWEKKLNGQQFDIVITKIQAMLQDVVKERERQLMESNAVAGQTQQLEQVTGISSVLKTSPVGTTLSPISQPADMFAPKIGGGVSAAGDERPAPYRDSDFYGRSGPGVPESSTETRRYEDDPFYLKRGPEYTEKDKQEKERGGVKTKNWKSKRKSGKKDGTDSVDLLSMQSAATAGGSLLDSNSMFNQLSLAGQTTAPPPPIPISTMPTSSSVGPVPSFSSADAFNSSGSRNSFSGIPSVGTSSTPSGPIPSFNQSQGLSSVNPLMGSLSSATGMASSGLSSAGSMPGSFGGTSLGSNSMGGMGGNLMPGHAMSGMSMGSSIGSSGMGGIGVGSGAMGTASMFNGMNLSQPSGGVSPAGPYGSSSQGLTGIGVSPGGGMAQSSMGMQRNSFSSQPYGGGGMGQPLGTFHPNQPAPGQFNQFTQHQFPPTTTTKGDFSAFDGL